MRVIAVVIGIGVLTMSRCWAHGHSVMSGPPLHQSNMAPAAPVQQKPFHDWLQPDTGQKNPYEKMSCPELYALANQSAQTPDMAKAFEDKDCHAL